MKKYCAKSCGFCFKPPPTEVTEASTVLPTLTTNPPFITFWRTSTPSPRGRTGTTSFTTSEPSTSHSCKDRKHFCQHWKMAGFCEGIFMSYMKKNCAASCGMC
ncbi:shTK domain protein, partial [Ostertagia ostertagi]